MVYHHRYPSLSTPVVPLSPVNPAPASCCPAEAHCTAPPHHLPHSILSYRHAAAAPIVRPMSPSWRLGDGVGDCAATVANCVVYAPAPSWPKRLWPGCVKPSAGKTMR